MKTVRNYLRTHILQMCVLMVLPLLASIAVSCDDDDEGTKYLPTDLRLTEIAVQDSYTVPSDGTITIQAIGFASGDGITLTNADKEVYTANVTGVTDNSITFGLPSDFPQTGTYTIRAVRGDEAIFLGNAKITLIYNFGVKNIVVEPSYTILSGKTIRIAGEGFLKSDVLTFTKYTADKKGNVTYGDAYTAETVSADGTGIELSIPSEMGNTAAAISMTRNSRTADIGTTTITFAMDTEMPTKAGATVMGMVYCGFEPIAGVVISDGVNVTTTDENGRYYLNSNKDFGYIFISTPGGYTTGNIGKTNTPAHFQRTTAAAGTLEQINFELTKEDQSEVALLTFADMHLAKRNDDISQFEAGFIVDVNELIKQYEANGYKVYGVTLGDQAWDNYWYENNYGLTEAMTEVNKINCSTFNCMGNHDNDPYCADNFTAQQAFIDIVGPNYYSFNLGKTHVVVLDDIYYINKGGLQGTIGDRTYSSKIDDVQMAWLKKDLATIADKTAPLIICAHIQLNSRPTINSDGTISQSVSMSSGQDLISALSSFSNVKVLTGHTHINYAGSNGSNIFEQNTAAVCATWWWTGKSGYANNHICRDGTPGGYGIWTLHNRTVAHSYKSIGYNLNYQFRTTDLNQVQITAERFAPSCTTPDDVKTYASSYTSVNNSNQVLIYVFNWNEGWSIKVTEDNDGKTSTLTPKRISSVDPLHIISYEMMRLNVNKTPTESFVTTTNSKTFMVTASSATSTLEITVTDNYGNVYTETMQRPKAFWTGMK
jgi:hypothetical protein